jgi:chloramphenicol-sensitive protein RarD
LILAGVVTAVPLLLFSSAARSIPLSMIGFMQYIAPTLQLFIGIFVFGEPFTHDRLIGFAMIWAATLVFTFGGFYERRRTFAAAA